MQPIKEYKYLKFAKFRDLKFWDYNSLTKKSGIDSPYELVTLSKVLKHRKNFIIIDDEKDYKRCRVQLYGNGIVLRDIIKGKELKTKKQQVCKEDDFLIAEIDAKSGGYGIVPKNLEGAIVSGHYFLFEIKKEMLLPEFLSILIKCRDFSKQVKATGSTNYAAIRPYHVSDYIIPLPPFTVQERITNAYFEKSQLAEKQEKEVIELEQKTEKIIYEELSLKSLTENNNSNRFSIIQYKDMLRWDVFSLNNSIYKGLKKGKYELKTLGSVFRFVYRPWKKQNHLAKVFNYIEIGAVDPVEGITEIKEIEIKKAPSRATQIVNEGDLIIGTTRPYLKKFAIIPKDFNGYICSSGFSVIEKSDSYNLEYLKQFLMCTYGIEQLRNKMTGALYPAITETELKNILIPLPDKKNQDRIVNKVTKIKMQIRKKIKEAEQNRKSALEEFEKAIFNTN